MAVAVSISLRKRTDEPDDAFPEKFEQRHFEIGFVEGFGTADLLDIFGKFFLGDPEDVVDGDDAEEDLLIV